MSFLMRFQFVIAFLLGAFSVLGFAPYYWFVTPIIALTVLFMLHQHATSAKHSFLLGSSFGLGLYCVGIYWIYISLHTFGGMPPLFAAFCTFCLCAFMALFPALALLLSKRLGCTMLTAPVLWGVSDWVRSWIFTGFPWLTLGYSQVPHSPLAGYAPVFGIYGVSILTALIASVLAAWFVSSPSKPSKQWQQRAIAGLTALVVVGLVLKVYPWSKPVGKPTSVALIQGNISQLNKWSPEHAQRTIDIYTEMVNASDAELTIIPETALPVVASRLGAEIKAFFMQKGEANQGNVLVGIVTNPQGNDYYNSVISYGASPTQTYSKNHLVPFGEFIPLKAVFGWIYRDWLNMPLSDLSRGGTHQQPMQLGHQQVAMNICYEDVFGEEVMTQLPAATLMVNVSNDAWYGQSFAADQHMQFSQARALEAGRMMLRATNTGATAIIDKDGQVLQHAPHDMRTTLVGQAQGYTGTTPYVVWGNWPFILFSAGVIAFVMRRKNK